MEALAKDLRANTRASIAAGSLAQDLESALEDHDIIIQGTPLGMYPKNAGETPVPKHLLRPGHVVFDMVYRPLKTQLIKDAESAGCATIPGAEMLLNQAVLQFETWTGAAAPREAMREALLDNLGQEKN